MFTRLLRWLLPSIVEAFRCVVCDAIAHLTAAAAKKLGWHEVSGGWECPACCGKARGIA